MKRIEKQSKKVLVTGGAGFLGSHLCRSLLEDGHQVTCLDNFSSGSERNTRRLTSFSRYRLIEHDVIQPIDLDVQEIYNLACVASPIQYQESPIQTLRTSVSGADNMLGLAVRKRATLLQASTSEVYGDPAQHPQREEYFGNVNPVGMRACYDEGKRCAETLCMDYHRVHHLDVRIARIFNTYGPLMQIGDGRVISNFIVQALLNRPITIYGDGLQTRSFCYVEDLIRGIRALMDASSPVTGPVNLGNPTEISVRELAERVIELTGSSSKLVHRPLPSDDPVRRKPDIGRAIALLDWQPKRSLHYGLACTIRYFDELLSEQGESTQAMRPAAQA